METGLNAYAAMLKQDTYNRDTATTANVMNQTLKQNPYNRGIVTTANIMNQMPQGGGITGMEGIGKIPLMYSMGQDVARAQQYDEQANADIKNAAQGLQMYQQQHDIQKMQTDEFGKLISLVKEGQIDAANQFAKQSPIIQSSSFRDITMASQVGKDGFQDWEVTSPDSKTVDKYKVNILEFARTADRLEKSGAKPTQADIFANMPAGALLSNLGVPVKSVDFPFQLHNGVPKGDKEVSVVFDPNKGSMTEVGRGPRWNPRPTKEEKPINAASELIQWDRALAPEYNQVSRFLRSKLQDYAAAKTEEDRTRILMSPGSLTPEGEQELARINAKRKAGVDHIVTGGTASSAAKLYAGQSAPRQQQQPTAVRSKIVNGLPYYLGSDGNWYEGPR